MHCNVCLELLVVLVDLRLAIILHTFYFLNEVLHKNVDLAANNLSLLFELCQKLIA